MEISIRLSPGLTTTEGRASLSVNIEEDSTVEDVVNLLAYKYPDMASRLDSCVAVVAGKHVDRSYQLTDRQEMALLIPISGGDC
jgi:molybdopterin converting factor small subunit